MPELDTKNFYIANNTSSIICGSSPMSVCSSPTTHFMICCPDAKGVAIQVSSPCCWCPWYVINRQTHEDLDVPLFADHITALTAVWWQLFLCDGHQQPLYNLLLISFLPLSLCLSMATRKLSLNILLLVPLPQLSLSLSVMVVIINNHNSCFQILFVSSLHMKHLGAQPIELMTLLSRSNLPSTTTDNCSRRHNHPCQATYTLALCNQLVLHNIAIILQVESW